jgi:small subunit ribosomal protein S15
MSLLKLFLLNGLVVVSGWTITPNALPGSSAQRFQTSAKPLACGQVVMQEGEESAAPAEEAGPADFTEELLDALAADEVPLSAMDSQPAFVKADDPEETLEARVGYVNSQLVDEFRKKYQLHETDSGSSQVQIAVLTARISYMTTHMQQNKKDYASLRGLTRMVVRRRKLLEYLMREDFGEFKRITSELNIRTNQLLKPKLSGARGRRVSAGA